MENIRLPVYQYVFSVITNMSRVKEIIKMCAEFKRLICVVLWFFVAAPVCFVYCSYAKSGSVHSGGCLLTG